MNATMDFARFLSSGCYVWDLGFILGDFACWFVFVVFCGRVLCGWRGFVRWGGGLSVRFCSGGGGCPGVFCPGGLFGGVLSGGFCLGGFVQGVLSTWGFCQSEGFVQLGIAQGFFPWGFVRRVLFGNCESMSSLLCVMKSIASQ